MVTRWQHRRDLLHDDGAYGQVAGPERYLPRLVLRLHGQRTAGGGTKYTSVTGVAVSHFGEWRLLPRSAADPIK